MNNLRSLLPFLIFILLLQCKEDNLVSLYPSNPNPLVESRFVQLPLGAIRAEGWLKDQLTAQKNGLTGHLEDFWPDLMNSAWKGGPGESWERGPYYLDGLVPLAYILDDYILKAKARNWIDYILQSQRTDGWFGPPANADRWPLAVALKSVSQYFEISGDPKAQKFIENYFDYLHRFTPDWPDSTWRGMRAMENAVTGYWLYRRNHDPKILETIQTIFENSFNWTDYFYRFPWDSAAVSEKRIPQKWDHVGLTAHVVNNAMAIKYPGLWYQQSGDDRHKQAVYEAIKNFDLHHGQIGGRFSGDEHLSGKSPIQGTELCAVIEYMFSLENLIPVLGDVNLADRLEMLAYNAVPAAMTPDFWAHQYDQQANQVLVSRAMRKWSSNGPTANIYGLMPNYPCCLANMHQAWPKFVANMWMATPDNGLALIAYGPSAVQARVGGGEQVTLHEVTNYPFENSVELKLEMRRPTEFPLYLRIPAWAEGAVIRYKGKTLNPEGGQFIVLRETWKNNDAILIVFQFRISFESRFNRATAIRKGPLYFSLRIDKTYKPIIFNEKAFYSIIYMGSADWEIYPAGKWNYALILDKNEPERLMETERFPIHAFPFADIGDQVYDSSKGRFEIWDHHAPVVLRVKGIEIPDWKLQQNSAADVPLNPFKTKGEPQELFLVPYGSTRLRISEFPVLENQDVTIDH